MAGIYQTKQQKIILTCLVDHADRPLSAKEVFSLCRQSGHPVGLATVYRHLEELVQQAQVTKILSDGQHILFQYLSQPSFTLKCDCCGRTEPAGCSLLEQLADHMGLEHGFQVDSTRSVLYGRCQDCKEEPAHEK